MEIPELGQVTKDEELGWYFSEPIEVTVLGGKKCRVVVEGYDDDPDRDSFHLSIKNFLAADETVLRAAAPEIYRYYLDCNALWEPGDEEHLVIESAEGVWRHVRLGDEPMITRRPYGDKGVYVTLECGCDWEPEHGLQIVFKDGRAVNKVGPYDGHLTNSDAYADDRLETVVYRGR